MILNKNQIIERLKNKPPIVNNIKNLNLQIQPAGLDLTVKEVYIWDTLGSLDFDNSKRKLSKKHEIEPRADGIYHLEKGNYQIKLNETFNIPTDILAFTVSRSTLQRCGASILQGYFEPGFIGEGFCLLEVFNTYGLLIHKNAKICQMIFHKTEPTESYNGVYNASAHP